MTVPAAKSKHRLLFELGRGGMGTVFLAAMANDGAAPTLRVVKHLRGDLAMQPSFLRSFLDEAKLAMRLHHPNVVETNDVGFDGTHYFIEMEYLEGQTLETCVRRMTERAGADEHDGHIDVPLPLALLVVGNILAALHYAHELEGDGGVKLRVVHRDVSPHNVMVTYDGAVKLLDFGIAKAADASSETTTGVVKGKLTYMSPEQATRAPVDRRADLFAVGVILWQLVTGRRLWQGVPEVQIFHKLDQGEIEHPRALRPDVPEALDAICMKALARSPDARFATAAEMQAALEAQLDALDARATERQLADKMADLFAAERVATKEQVEARLLGNEDAGVAGPPPLALGLRADRLATQSGATVTRSVAREGASSEGASGSSRVGAGRLRRALMGAAGVAAVAGVAMWASRGAKVTPSGPATSASQLAAAARCTTNAACVKEHGGKPFICRKENGTCVSLESPKCKVISEPGDVENDETIWIGTMFPMSGSAAEEFGSESVNAADLARRDFMTIARGIPYPSGNRPPRPLGLIACDDAEDPMASARHLAVDVHVPAVVGFRASQEVIDLAGAVFIPNGVVAMATQNQSPLLSTIPHPPGSPRMVWRTTASSAQSVAPVAALVSEVIEPQVRPKLKPGEAMRLLLLRVDNTGGLSISATYFDTLRWNGKSASTNGEAFREIAFDTAGKDLSGVVREVIAFRPHVILLPGVDGFVSRLLEPIERGLAPADRSRYVVGGYLAGEDFFAFARDEERRHRFFGVIPIGDPIANGKLALRYNQFFTPKVSAAAAPGAVYDAMYALAYAAHTVDGHLAGSALAAAFSRLRPGSGDAAAVSTIHVGPTEIFDGFKALVAGGVVDLQGAATRLDFDAATGNASSDFSIVCMERLEGGAVRATESNVRFRAATSRLEGLPLRCR